MKIVAGVIASLVVAPIWYYLIYKLLEAANATELMWFLYWIYVPAAVLTSALIKIAEAK